NPQIYYNVGQEPENSAFGELFVQLDPAVKPDQKKAIIEELRQRWGKFEGAKIKVKDFQQGMPMPAPVEVKILGDNLGTLRELAAQIEDSLKATPGTLYVHNPVKNHKSDIRVHINKAKAHSFGVPM